MPLTHSAVPLAAATAFAPIPDAFEFIQPIMKFLGMIQGAGSAPK